MRIYFFSIFAVSVFVSTTQPLLAQVFVQMQGGQIVINNAGYAPQEAFQTTSKSGSSTWMVDDNQGNVYDAGMAGAMADVIIGAYQDDGGSGGSGGGSGGSSGGGGGGGYQDTRDHLLNVHGAVIQHDSTLGVDMVWLPGSGDPVQDFFTIITTDTLGDGTLLIEHLGMAEITNFGSFDDPIYTTPSAATPFSFPNDPYYDDQWNLAATILSKAVWHPTASPQKTVRIAVIDSGVGTTSQGSDDLDGLPVTHRMVAPTSGWPADHGLGIVSLLSDKNDEADGIGGLLGRWNTTGCYGRSPLLEAMLPEVYSYNVGDYAPSSLEVARAIHQSIADAADVINLSLRMAYSPVVEDAVNAALAAGVTVVAAAGNYVPGAPRKKATFPANLPGVIAVAAGDASLQYIDTSADKGVDLIAPGDDILVARSDGTWHEADGTSFAAPHVTATVALMIAVNPTLTPSQVLTALQEGANRNGGTGSVGFLDAGGALNQVVPPAQQVAWLAEPFPHEVCGGAGKGGSVATASETDEADALAGVVPEAPALLGSYPNPFNPQTTISFQVPARQQVRLAVFNVLGQPVQVLVDGYVSPGRHEARFVADGLPSGTYFTRLETEGGVVTKSIVLMK